MYTSITEIRVRYGETDKMGYLYHGYYIGYYDVGRTEAMRQLGFEYSKMEDMGLILPVTSVKSKYVRPAKYDELLQLETTLQSYPKSGLLTFRTEVSNEDGDLLNVGVVNLVCVDKKTRKRCDIPKDLLDRLKPYFEEDLSQ